MKPAWDSPFLSLSPFVLPLLVCMHLCAHVCVCTYNFSLSLSLSLSRNKNKKNSNLKPGELQQESTRATRSILARGLQARGPTNPEPAAHSGAGVLVCTLAGNRAPAQASAAGMEVLTRSGGWPWRKCGKPKGAQQASPLPHSFCGLL